MTLDDVPPKSSIYIDANVFIYHFAGRSEQCSTFLARVEAGELRGFTGRVTLLEVAHRLMMLEGLERGLKIGTNPAAILSAQPELVRQLSKYYFSARKVTQLGIESLPLPTDFLEMSQEYRQQYGLLVNDSLVPLHMREVGLSLLASADAAFDRVPWVTRAGPSDL